MLDFDEQRDISNDAKAVGTFGHATALRRLVHRKRSASAGPHSRALVLIMRHAPQQPPRVVEDLAKVPPLRDKNFEDKLTENGATAAVVQIGRALAETFHELAAAKKGYDRLVVAFEVSNGAAEESARLLRRAYVASRKHFKDAPPVDEPVLFDLTPPSPYEQRSTFTQKLDNYRAALQRLGNRDDCSKVAVLLVGHDPRMSALIGRLLRPARRFLSLPRRRARVPALAHTELLACEVARKDRFVARWALSPSDKTSDESVRTRCARRWKRRKSLRAC